MVLFASSNQSAPLAESDGHTVAVTGLLSVLYTALSSAIEEKKNPVSELLDVRLVLLC